MNVNFPGGAWGGAENWPNLLKTDQNYGFPDSPPDLLKTDQNYGLPDVPEIF